MAKSVPLSKWRKVSRFKLVAHKGKEAYEMIKKTLLSKLPQNYFNTFYGNMLGRMT